MIHIEGMILTVHPDAACCGAAVTPDNHGMILTTLTERGLESTVSGTNLRSIIATVDDYLMNLGVAEETCLYDSH
jgi:hypothetical protein